MSTVSFWQKRLAEIYPNTGTSPDYLMSHLYTACSDIGRILLRKEPDKKRDAAVLGVISWSIAISNHFGIDYESSLVKRFPRACHYCLGRPCVCLRTGKHAYRHEFVLSQTEVEQEILGLYQTVRNTATVDFTWLLSQLDAIYPGNRVQLARDGQNFVVGKMLEEGGELHRAYSLYLRGKGEVSDIGDELADLAGWVLSCWDLEGRVRNIDTELSSLYLRGCPTCKSTPCSCPRYSITQGQEQVIRELAQALRSFDQIVQAPEINQIAEEAEETALSPTPDNKKRLFDKVRSIVPGMRIAAESTEAAASTVKNVDNLLTNLQQFLPM